MGAKAKVITVSAEVFEAAARKEQEQKTSPAPAVVPTPGGMQYLLPSVEPVACTPEQMFQLELF